MMTDLNKVVKVALIALTMLVGAQGASADDVATVVENTKAPFGFATRSSRTEATAYNITGGGVYTVDAIKTLIDGKTKNVTFTADGKKVIVLTSDGTSDMAEAIKDAITANDIIVFDGSGTSKDFQVYSQIKINGLANKTLMGLNGARLCTKWHMTDIIKSWLNSVETSSGSGVSNASTAAGTGGTITVDGKVIAIDEEGEWLTRSTLLERGEASKAKQDRGEELSAQDLDNIQFLLTEKYREAGVLYIEGCSNFVIRNISFVGPGSVDVGGVDLVSVINGSHHIWVDHCEFIDGQDGNFDITNYSDFITASWCHFHYTDRSYVHQNTNLVGSGDGKAEDATATGDKGKLNITFAYNEWGENCRSRMPMGRAGKIHLLNNWYNCAGNTEYAVNPRLNSEFLIEGNYFAKGVTKTFRSQGSIGVGIKDNTVADAGATAVTASGSTVTIPYEYKSVASSKVPDMVDLLVGPVLDYRPDFDEEGCINVDNHEAAGQATPGYYLTVTTNRAKQGLTFSVWANHVMTYQWYKATLADLSDAVAIKDADRNSYTFEDPTETTTYLYCVATGLAGSDQSNPIKITVSGSDSTPEFKPDLDSQSVSAYSAIVGSVFDELRVDAGENATYQWYKNSKASTEGATAIRGATSKTYSFTPTSAEKALGFEFFYCVATSTIDASLTAQSNIARVVYKSGTNLIHFVATSTTAGTPGGGDITGIFLINPEGATSNKTEISTKNYDKNSTPLSILALNTSLIKSSAYTGFSIKLETEGGFKAGDEITLAGFYNKGEEKEAKATLFTLGEGNVISSLHTTEQFIDGKITAGNPKLYTYTLESDADALYIGRTGGTGVFLSKIIVYRAEEGETLTPYIKTDLNDETPYAATAKTAVELSIVAEQTSSYAWYTCTSPTDYDAGKTLLTGQTTATCSYTPTEAGTTYVYCVVSNGTGDDIKTAYSKIATVVAASGGATRPVTYTWDFDNGDGKKWNGYENSADGKFKSYESVEDSSQEIDYYGGSNGITADDKNYSPWTHYLKTGGGSKIDAGNELRLFKYTPPYAGRITVYAKGGGSGARTLYVNNTLSEAGAGTLDGTGNAKGTAVFNTKGNEDIYIWANGSFLIYGIKAELQEPAGMCSKPRADKGVWSGDATQKWTYTVSSTTETAHIHYKINDGEEQVEGDNSVALVLSPGDKVKTWAVDPTEELDKSAVLEFTADAAAQAAKPTMTVGNYSVANKGFEVTIAVADGSAIYYTTDGTAPTESSATYSSAIYVAPGATVKAIAVKDYYGPSDAASATMLDFTLPGGMEQTLQARNTADGKNNVGISYSVKISGNANRLSDGLKLSGTGSTLKAIADTKGVVINVNSGFRISKIVANKITSNNQNGTLSLAGVYVDKNSNNLLAEPQVLPCYGDKNDEGALTDFVIAQGINATERIELAFSYSDDISNKQINALFDIYYEINDSPVSVTVSGKVGGVADEQVIEIGDFTENAYTILKTIKRYDENPTVTLNTTQGYHHVMNNVAGDGDYSRWTFTLMGTTYTLNAKVSAIKAPFITVDEDKKGLTFYRDALGKAKGGYEVKLSGIAEGTTPYIILDGGSPIEYDAKKKYYALNTVSTYCSYIDEDTHVRTNTATRDEVCPDNDYDEDKPFAVFVYQGGYQDTGAGQEDGASSSSWEKNKDKDQIYLGLTDQYNVIDIELDDDKQKQMINEIRPDIRNAQLVVLSEMIGSKTPESSSVYAASKLQNVIMSVRDSLIGYTNVLNLKMFFYSQSQNNTTRWAWAQPATLPNSVVSIQPANSLYKVFENVVFNLDGSIPLWSGYDPESSLNRLQLVHNFNEDNDDLPAFTSLATATDDYGEVYEALHYFEKNGFTYVGTGISINDYLHYDENMRGLISTIGKMINDGTSLGTEMDYVPAPRVKDNGDGSATITNNKPQAKTYYLTTTSETRPAEWGVDDAAVKAYIKANGSTTVDHLTNKFNSDVYLYAISDVEGDLSGIATAKICGSTFRFIHRTTDDAEVTGKEADIRFRAESGSVTIPYNQSFVKPGYTVKSWKDKYNPSTTYTPGQTITTSAASQDLYLVAVWEKNEKKLTDASSDDASLRTVTWNFRQSDGAPAIKLENGSTTVGTTAVLVGQMKFDDDNDGTIDDFIDVPMTINADGTASLPDTGETYTGKFDNTNTSYSDIKKEKYLSDFAQVRTGTTFTFPAVYGMQVKYKQATFEKYDDRANNVREKSQSYVSQSELTSGTLTNPGLVLDVETGKVAVDGNGVATPHATYGATNLSGGGVFDYTSKTDTLATLTSKESACYMAPDAPATTTKTVGGLNFGSVFMESLSVVYPALYDLSVSVDFHEGHVNILPNKLELTDEQIKARAAKVTLTEANKNCDGRYNAGERLNITVVPGYSFYFQDDWTKDIKFTSASGETAPSMTISDDKKTASGSFTIQPNTVVNILLKQKPVHAINTGVTPLSTGTLRIDSRTGKSAEDEYTMFPEDSTILIKPTPKIGYQFARWTNAEGVAYGAGTWPEGVTEDANHNLTMVVSSTNTLNDYVAVFEKGYTGTVNYRLPWAGLYKSDTSYEQFGTALNPGTIENVPQAKQSKYLYKQQYPNYKFPVSRETSALYIPTSYTLYKPGYTLMHWAHIEGFNENDPATYYTPENVTEYNIGTYYYFNGEGDSRDIIPIFRENDLGGDNDEKQFDYRTTTADITWDFRTAYMAQRLYFDTPTEFDYATHTTINADKQVIDVPLHIKGTADNTALDEWCHFDQGTVITIPSGLGAKFTFVTYHKLSSTTIDGEVPLEYTTRTENDIPVYYYTYTTHSTKTSIDLVIGKDHTYFKYIRAQLPSAQKITLTTTTNNASWGNSELVKVSTTQEKIADEDEPSDVTYTTDGNVYTMPLGSYVKVKATRERLYELKAFVVDGDTLDVTTPANIAAAASKGYTISMPEGTEKEYTLKFRMQTYATVVEAVYGDRQKWQITYSPGTQAYGEAPGAVVVEDGEQFTMPAKNQTLYLEGYTLKKWVDEDGNYYEWGSSHLPTGDIFLTPVFEINDFTLFDIPSGYQTVTWPLTTGNDATYGGGAKLKYQKSSGVYVSQLTLGDTYIDMPLMINCAEAGKVDNTSTDYRCQVNSGTVMTLLTNRNCRVTLYTTANGKFSSSKIFGTAADEKRNNAVSGTTTDFYYTQNYTGDAASQTVQFTGDVNYLKMIKVEYGKVDTDKETLPKLKLVTINNIALGSYGSPYESYLLKTLQNNKIMDINIDLSTRALSMPQIKAEADQSDAIVEVTQPTFDVPEATIIVKTEKEATVGIYKLEFHTSFVDIPAPVLQKIEIGGALVRYRDVNGDWQPVSDWGTANINGAISLTFDHAMNPMDLTAEQTGIGKAMKCTSTNDGKTLVFSYWDLNVNKEYTFTIPSGTLSDVYNNKYGDDEDDGEDDEIPYLPITFSFTTNETAQKLDNRKINFVVTHKQSHTFNSANPTENYTSGVKRQVASDELIANLDKAGIAYGTIDEGIAMAHATGGTDRFYIFVPDGEYQIKGNQATDAISSAPYDGNGKPRNELMAKIYNGVTAIRRVNVSITGQSEANTKIWNMPEIEGISYTSTFMVNSGVTGFYMQDMTLTNKFDFKSCIGGGSSAARAVVFRDRGSKSIMKNVTMDSWQDTYYSNVVNKENDTRGYFEDCTIKGYVDFVCGDGNHWFERCNLVLRNGKAGNASNMVAPRTYANQQWGYVFNKCQITAEDDVTYNTCNNKFTLARPWGNSPATSFLYTKYSVLPSADGYKQMTAGGLVLRMHEYGSTDANLALLDLSERSLRASSPGAGSYSAVMTPAEAAEYTVQNALGGTDGYDPTIYTKQVSMEKANLTSVDRSLSWDGQSEALCYFIFRKTESGDDELFAITKDTSYELDDAQIGRTFIVRAANQRGGLGEPSHEFTYEVHESFQLTLTENQTAPIDGVDWCWSTIYLDYNAKAPTVADDNDKADAYVYAVVNVTPISMTLKRVDILEKNQGYIVKGKPGTYTFAYTDSDGKYSNGDLSDVAYKDYTAVKAGRMSILDGVVETTARAGKEVYTLYYKENYGLGFYTYTGNYLNANKAYLDGSYVGTEGTGGIVIGGTESAGFIFLDDLLPTDLQKLRGTADDDSERIYTISGQRVKRSEMIKGRVYIVNGRKIAYQ